jgi:hypothetical protein
MGDFGTRGTIVLKCTSEKYVQVWTGLNRLRITSSEGTVNTVMNLDQLSNCQILKISFTDLLVNVIVNIWFVARREF